MNYYQISYSRGEQYEQVRPFLIEGEQVIWFGQPYASTTYIPSLYSLLVSLFFFVFSIFWMAMVFATSVFFACFGIPVMVVGAVSLYKITLGARRSLKNTVYAVTDRRAMILQKTRKGTVCYEFLFASLMQISLGEERGTGGNIFFNIPSVQAQHTVSVNAFGMTLLPDFSRGFLMIDNVRDVYRLIQKQIGRM